jgi:hypothetical protein
MYKLLERLILQRIQPLIEAASPIHQAGFRSCTEQVIALTTHIEVSFQRQLNTGVVFVDLSAAYETVWRDGIMLKFMRTVRKFLIYTTICCQTASINVNQSSNGNRWRRLNNGLPQGSFLAPILFTYRTYRLPP